MREMGLPPYKIKLLQELQPCDYSQRLAFGKWLKDNITELGNIIRVWSDEMNFSLDGLVNRHNCVIWAFENPRAIQTKLCVWIGFSSRLKLELFSSPKL